MRLAFVFFSGDLHRFARGLWDVRGGAENVLHRGTLLGYVWLENCTAGTVCQSNSSLPIGKIDPMGRFPVIRAEYRF